MTASQPPRALKHPGPSAPDRIQSAVGALVEVQADLETGLPLAGAVEKAIAGSGIRAGAIRFTDLSLNPMRYVRPTFSEAPEHVAYYSAVHAPAGLHHMDVATATLGLRDGRVFIHCHALWKDERGHVRGGHILPLDAIVAAPTRATILGTPDANMVVGFDPETNFSLFNAALASATPAASADGRRLLVAKIRPNEDLHMAIETVCAKHEVRHAIVRSGIGSTIGAVFDDGRIVQEIPTEILVLEGEVETSADGAPRLAMELALIDSDGTVHVGRLRKGENPVLICFELILEVLR